MLTLPEIKKQRRQHLLEFFAWRFGTDNWNRALSFCTGLTPETIQIFRRRPVGYNTLESIERAAMHLGFRPGRLVNKSGRFVKPKSLKLPRWSDPACRIRFYGWRRYAERNGNRDKMSHLKGRFGTPAQTVADQKSNETSNSPVSIPVVTLDPQRDSYSD